MGIITLTSDYGTKDFFISAVKGAILSELNDTNIIDISHEVTPFHIAEGAYIVKNAYKNFPKKTVHIIAIDTEKQKKVYIMKKYLKARVLTLHGMILVIRILLKLE